VTPVKKDVLIDHANRSLSHVASKIRLRHDAIGLEAVVEPNGLSGPIGRRVLARAINEHIGVIVLSERCRHDPGRVAPPGCRWALSQQRCGGTLARCQASIPRACRAARVRRRVVE